MSVILIPPADQELQDAVIYYNGEVSGPGDQLYASFLDAVDIIAANPEMWQKDRTKYKKMQYQAFPLSRIICF
jgi:hypothetical protein